ncbi:delta8-fatty-acid desaturase [Cryptococcus gattii Ru294]|nr:delta8-fatty-acid desaturase [Cryptococcus gattii Ru294]
MSRSQKHIWDRTEIATRITQGQQLIIYRDRILNVTPWAPYHPGGALALLHFVGRDATNEIEAYHSDATIEMMNKFTVAKVDIGKKGWPPLTPPIALGLVRHADGIKGHWAREGHVILGQTILQQSISLDPSSAPIPPVPNPNPPSPNPTVITLEPAQLEPPASAVDLEREEQRSEDYRQLKKRLVEAGLFKPPGPLAGYGTDIIRYTLFAFGAFYLYFNTTGWLGQMGSATCLGLLFHQLAFLVHDAGHTEVTGIWWWDRVIGMTVASWIGGLSCGWWCDNHDIHHLVTNHPEHDPDIQHIPFFAISKKFFNSLWSTYYKRTMLLDAFAKIMIPFQHNLYYIVLSLARFNLYANSYMFLLGPKPKRDAFWAYEITGIVFYWAYYGSMLRHLPSWQMRLGYLLISHIMASPVHVQIVLSHFACSTEDLGPAESFPSRQLRTTMDVICDQNIEWIHGGLNLQVTHHLFPRLPRHNLRAASMLVKEYCKEHDIVYREHFFIEGNQHVLSTLRDVANQLNLLKKVADKEIDERMGRRRN